MVDNVEMDISGNTNLNEMKLNELKTIRVPANLERDFLG